MWKVVAEFRAGYICMHAQGSPLTMQKNPVYQNVVREVGEFFPERLEKLNAAGVAAEQVVLDPGIGFGKTLEHNLQLLAGLRSFAKSAAAAAARRVAEIVHRKIDGRETE